MPSTSILKSRKLASAVISTIVLVPSTKLVNIFGFIFFKDASFVNELGVANLLNGLFLPFPIDITSKESSVAKSYKSRAATGSSPSATVTMAPFFSASFLRANPIVASVSTFNKIKLIPRFKTFLATRAPAEGVPVASITISNSTLSRAVILSEHKRLLSLSFLYLLAAMSSCF